MDKFAKRLQSRLSAKGHRFTKEDCRQALSMASATPAEPTEEEMILAFNRLAMSVEETQVIVAVEAPEPEVKIEAIAPVQPEEIQIQEPAPEIQEPKSEQSSLTVADAASQIAQSPAPGITQAEVTQAISQAVAQVGADGNSEAIQLLTSLAQELSSEIQDVEQMASTLITAYLGKRQNILASAIGTVQTLRSAQTDSFQAGLNQDFFDRKQRNKHEFLKTVQGLFN